jgi:hypothetical protein
MDAFEYISILTSIIIGLGLAQLLLGVSRIIQHPDEEKPYWVHLSWVLTMFMYSVFWWWWEFNLNEIEIWTFGAYLSTCRAMTDSRSTSMRNVPGSSGLS